MDYKFSHVGIPTAENKKWDGFYEPGKIHYTDFANDAFNIEFIQCDADSNMPEMFQNVPHVAYEVDNIEAALEGKEILVETFSPGEGVRVAFIVHNGAPVEFMEIAK
ncbi:VOC family protein [Saccharicrinis aurantiacus]|uniref:hypothetical protein n=1 Tax=Saccharicrinis aurantiacus TaxID=1849719 RepID=UPI0008382268|nr:hypothetical protein [Saccharicrinis aurantiacus]